MNILKKIFFLIRTILLINFLFLQFGCSNLMHIVYLPTIHQGQNFINKNYNKIHIGMNKEQIIYILGYPIIKNHIMNYEIWYYIYRQQKGNNVLRQETLMLKFNKKNVLDFFDIKRNKKL